MDVTTLWVNLYNLSFQMNPVAFELISVELILLLFVFKLFLEEKVFD